LAKLKLGRPQEFVIGGYRPTGSFGALLVGYYADSELLFAGHVRAGLIPHVGRRLLETLKPLRISECPFANLPDYGLHRGGHITADQMPEMQWTKPELVAQIRFTRWTADNRLDHAAFLGISVDKPATETQRES
jgi:bifunctional non-homologous end joining protein LigD